MSPRSSRGLKTALASLRDKRPPKTRPKLAAGAMTSISAMAPGRKISRIADRRVSAIGALRISSGPAEAPQRPPARAEDTTSTAEVQIAVMSVAGVAVGQVLAGVVVPVA